MPDRSDKKPKFTNRLPVFGAMLLTLLLHFGLFGLFRFQPEAPPARRHDNSRIELLTVSSLPPAERSQFERWLETHDPRLIARADSRHAPTSQLRPARRHTPADLLQPELIRPLPERRPAPPEALAEPQQAAFRPFEFTGPAAPAVLPPERYPALRLDGRRAGAIALPETVHELARSLEAAGCVVEFSYTGDGPAEIPRFRVRQSSGSGNLDLQIVRALLPQLAPPAGGEGLRQVEIRWQPEKNP